MKRCPVLVLWSALALQACATPQGRSLAPHTLAFRARAGTERSLDLGKSSDARAVEVVAFAMAQVGKPYCWGGMGPRCFDCSGLADAAWTYVGARLPRTSEAMAARLRQVSADEVRPGDILWWPGHVAIYIGHGWLVDALDSRHGVVLRPATDPYRALRPEVPEERAELDQRSRLGSN
jgi:cell wall-associated NlpC family hydrolase